jgi:hypothetical protein
MIRVVAGVVAVVVVVEVVVVVKKERNRSSENILFDVIKHKMLFSVGYLRQCWLETRFYTIGSVSKQVFDLIFSHLVGHHVGYRMGSN